jgi:site-specific DNA recombinase
MDDHEPVGLRYAIYARKSTEDAEKQVRSIGDQVADCERLAAEWDLNVVQTITETKSATPGKRPKSTQLMRDIADKKVDGIIAWHPDRLARNMIEAGKIIHKLDTSVIKDLRFKTFQFSNDANGKMMLGMLFVFAEHYSDDLKTKVDRGMQNSLKEGKSSGSPKHGYIRDDDGLYRPDERNFELIREAWQKRANGASLTDIVQFLADSNYAKYSKRHGDYVIHKITKSSVGAMFADTFYYGLLNQKSQTVDLTALYNFVP